MAQNDDDTIAVKPADVFDEHALADHLAERVAGFKGPLSVRQFKNGRSHPCYLLHTPKHDYVLHRAPTANGSGSAAANGWATRFERERQVTAALAKAGFPVPKPLLLCTDDAVIGGAFLIADYRRGKVHRDPRLPGLDVRERAKVYDGLIDVFAQLHRFDPAALGLDGFKAPASDGAERLASWIKQYHDAQDEEIKAMGRLIDWLPRHPPTAEPDRIVHGDCRLDNVLFEPHESKVAALLDWDSATLGHPFADIARLCALYHATVPGLGGLEGLDPIASGIPGERDLVQSYCDKVGRAMPDDWHIHVARDLFRLAVVTQNAKKRAVKAGNTALAKQYAMLARAAANQSWHLVEGE